MVGLSLSMGMELRQAISLKQQIEQKLSMTQRMSLELYLEIEEFYSALYEKAKKERYTKHGFDFEYAAIRRKDLPKKALEFGPGFAILHCNPFTGELDPSRPPLRFVVIDYMADFPREYRDLVAIHEYGESLGIGHRESSLLEWGMAKEEGLFKRYLGWLAEHFPCKIADLEHASKIYDIMPEELWVSAQNLAETSEEAQRVLGFIKSFDFPPEAKALAERHEAVAKEIARGLIITGNEATRVLEMGETPDNVFIAAWLFRRAARDIVASGVHNHVSTRGTIEDAWKTALEGTARLHNDRRLVSEQVRGNLAMDFRIDSGRMQELEEAADKPFGWYLPQTFAFAIETEKAVLGAKTRKGDILADRLDRAMQIAKGKILISEDGTNDKIVTRPIFYIKAMIFEAVEAMVEGGRSGELSDGKMAIKFSKKIAKIEEAFYERAGKRLFAAHHGRIWTDLNEISRMYKSAFSLRADEEQKVVRFSPRESGIRELAPRAGRLAFSGRA